MPSHQERCLAPRAPSQYPKRRQFVRSRKVSKPRDWYFKFSYRFEIWQAHRQNAAEVPVKFQSDRTILNTNIAASRLYEILRKDVFSDIETGPKNRNDALVPSVNLISMASSNGLSPVRRQAITRSNADLLSIGPLGTNFREILLYKNTKIFIDTVVRLKCLVADDAYMRQWSGSTLFQVVAWRLIGANHYLNQWRLVNWNRRNKIQWIFNQYARIFIQNMEDVISKKAAILFLPQCVNASLSEQKWWQPCKGIFFKEKYQLEYRHKMCLSEIFAHCGRMVSASVQIMNANLLSFEPPRCKF